MGIRQGALESMEMNREFWKGKRIFLTGHTGFKGSWLTVWLTKLGAEVTGYALPPPTDPSLFNLANVSNGINSVTGNVKDLQALQKAVKDFRPDIILHMAAQALVRKSYEEPVDTYATNVMGTVNILEAARHCDSVRVILNVTSDKCYENNEWPWGYREIEPMGGYDTYSSSKGCAELVTSAYRKSFFPIDRYQEHNVAIASARAGNVIGGGDWAEDRLVPDIMNTISSGNPVIIRSPNAIRPWQHVLEPLRGYLMLIEKLWESGPQYAEGWNFGPNDDDAKPVEWIVNKLTTLWGNNASWKLDTDFNPHEAQYLKLDCSKARSLLGYVPKLRLADTLYWIVEWYRAYQDNGDIRVVTESQIEKYELLLNQ